MPQRGGPRVRPGPEGERITKLITVCRYFRLGGAARGLFAYEMNLLGCDGRVFKVAFETPETIEKNLSRDWYHCFRFVAGSET